MNSVNLKSSIVDDLKIGPITLKTRINIPNLYSGSSIGVINPKRLFIISDIIHIKYRNKAFLSIDPFSMIRR